MKQMEPGNKVAVHYIGTLDNGHIFDSCDDDNPLIFTLGDNEIFPALENEIIGMKIGEVRNIVIPAEDAFGQRRDDNIITLNRSDFPADQDLHVGQKISLDFKDGSGRIMLVIKVEGNQVTLDGNHALAGHDLTFALKLANIFNKNQ